MGTNQGWSHKTTEPTWMAEIQNQGLQGKTSNDSLCSCAFNFQLIPKPITLIFNTYINASTYMCKVPTKPWFPGDA